MSAANRCGTEGTEAPRFGNAGAGWFRAGGRIDGGSERGNVMMFSGLVAALLLAAPDAKAASGDPVFDVPALIATPLDPRTLKIQDNGAIITEEVRFHSERDGETNVDIFAFFSYPKGGRHLPAYIWNPGGLGQASPAFTEAGARRGYATLCIDFPQTGYRSSGNYPINRGLVVGDDPRKAPIAHGAVALLKAVSYLESRAEVDKNRIGMAGSSWGGFFTTLMTGLDPRLKVASCLYGSGNLQLGNAWWDGDSKNGLVPPEPAERERWRITLDPAWRLPARKTPIAWITGTNDAFYLLPGVMKTYDMTGGSRHLTLVPNWHHALPQKLHDELVIAWLDEHLQGKPRFPRVAPLTVKPVGGVLVAAWDFQGDADSAEVIVSFGEEGNWRGRCWVTLHSAINGRTCTAHLPASALPMFVSGSVSDRRGIRSSTPLLRVDAAALGVHPSLVVPDYDGCAEWGGFEENHVEYLARHDAGGQKRWVPELSAQAYEGKHSAILPPGQTILAPILSTATVPHRFTAFLKADQPVEVRIQLAGQEKLFPIGREWTEVSLDHTPPNTLMGGIPASITVPRESQVLMDALRFRPANSANP
jgi:dienelactone hydrolase